MTHEEATRIVQAMGEKARHGADALAGSTDGARAGAIRAMAGAIRRHGPALLAANDRDLTNLPADYSPAFRDRLTMTPERLEGVAAGLERIADLPDPVGRVLEAWKQPNGLSFKRVSAPIGVVGMIYESRPNVGPEAAALCLRAGNAVLLRGGSDSHHTARAFHEAMVEGLKEAGLSADMVQVMPTTDRALVGALLQASGLVDLIIPRGGKKLVERVLQEARVPVLAHAEGLCHTYVHKDADHDMARSVLLNAKMRRPGICGATETLLIDEAIAPALLPLLVADLEKAGCTFKADEKARDLVPTLPAAREGDFATEWLGPVLSVRVVGGLDEALDHIHRYGSGHTEAIITENERAAEKFINGTNSAVVMVNASTQFCDGGEFGFGAEIGIATGKIHARGPVGAEQLTCYRYEVRGSGQVRG
ncbi:glutamate-5-semialdehyde dehydrogenase [Formicincola oecophyllae]|uniref:Gamma-glutamyl phosphate reductase n=2 Tax=Formicincola oecophyllae TaxID=2558361 RepID=A0A4Y6UD44_9PROT|nr:glutamate-5-semialdehyde dehydrogenase [Formicincola oecophyllae]QDH14357.1 glutamate-5-semialdehyde dehydrogenase [Formicincola oecophyllae]